MAFIVILVLGLFVALILWLLNLKERMSAMESRIGELSERINAQSNFVAEIYRQSQAAPRPAPDAPAAQPVHAAVPAPQPILEPVRAPMPPAPPPPRAEQARPVEPVHPEKPTPQPEPRPVAIPVAQPAAPAPREWETILGGSWLNKIGVFVLVVGLALLLRYSFTQFGPFGRVAICLASSLSLLLAGAIFESRERYRVFARGLLGGGWAGLYVTVYAMHAVEAARVIESPAVGAVLLLMVAAGMIVHSLRYRSPTVTGLAYFVAFATLAITDMTSLPFLALVPLAASLLYVSHRFLWTRMAMLGMIATYAVVVIRGDTGAPLWQAQAIFFVYWLLFELFDVLHPETWLLPINAAGALGLSVLKWQTAAPDRLWILLAVAAVAYAASGVARIRSGRWQSAATLTAGLAAAAIFQKLDHQWIASALVVEAEIFYLAGIRLRAPYLRWLGTSLFGLEALRLLVNDVASLPADQWVPVASVDAAIFYANRALNAADKFFGYAGAAALALVIGKASEPYRSVAWQLAGAGMFAFGWWRRLFDFRMQGYSLVTLGLAGTALFQGYLPQALGVGGAAIETHNLPLIVAAIVCYAVALCAMWSVNGRLGDDERNIVRFAGTTLSVSALMALVWRLVPGEYLGVAWLALALLILEMGQRRLPPDLCRRAYAAVLVAVFRIWTFNVLALHNTGPWEPRLMPLWTSLLAYAIAWRARREERGAVMTRRLYLRSDLWGGRLVGAGASPICCGRLGGLRIGFACRGSVLEENHV